MQKAALASVSLVTLVSAFPAGAGPSTAQVSDPGLCDESAPEAILGTEKKDNLSGSPGDDIIAAYGGSDIIDGLGGNDIICGSDGNDHITGGPGDDLLDGRSGNTVLELLATLDNSREGGFFGSFINTRARGGCEPTIRESFGVVALPEDGPDVTFYVCKPLP